MRRFCFAVLAGTAAAVPPLFTEVSAANNAFSAVDCSEQMNKAREPMGFPKFTVLDTTTHADPENTVNTSKLCETIKGNEDPGVWITETDISVAAAIQSSTEGDCAAATKQWKGVLKAMGDSLPPAYTPGEGIYNNLDVVSLMSLYTPKEGVAVTCTVIQCPGKGSPTDNDQNDESTNGKDPNSTPQPPTSPPSDEGTGGATVGTGGNEAGSQTAGSGSPSGSGSQGEVGDKGKTRELKEEAKDLSKEKKDKLLTPITGSEVSAGEVVGVSPPAAPAAAAAEGAGGVRGGIRVRRLAEGDEGVTEDESFNALVCIFKPKTLT
ncbi:SAG family member, partial [Eimeria maxima]